MAAVVDKAIVHTVAGIKDGMKSMGLIITNCIMTMKQKLNTIFFLRMDAHV